MENTDDVEVTIDPATGLPALEDGLYWEVSRVEEKDKVRSYVPDYLRVAIKRRVAKERRSVSTLFLMKETYFEEEVLHSRDLIDYKRPYSGDGVSMYLSEGYVKIPKEDEYDYSYPVVRYWDQTEENVSKAAREVYAKYEEDVREKERKRLQEAAKKLKDAENDTRMNYLTGTYPPKKLGGN